MEFLAGEAPSPVLGHEDASTPLHEERLHAVTRLLLDSGAKTVLDLGCGSGALLKRLIVEKQFTRIVGIDTSLEALQQAEQALVSAGEPPGARAQLLHDSFTSADKSLTGFDAAALVETIEHIRPERLSKVERAVFAELRPALVVITTPNREYNVLYGMREGELRHSDHCFEWSRAKFESWAAGVAERNGYRATLHSIGPADPVLGSPTQMGAFHLRK